MPCRYHDLFEDKLHNPVVNKNVWKQSRSPECVFPVFPNSKENIPTERPAELTWNPNLHLLWIIQGRYFETCWYGIIFVSEPNIFLSAMVSKWPIMTGFCGFIILISKLKIYIYIKLREQNTRKNIYQTSTFYKSNLLDK